LPAGKGTGTLNGVTAESSTFEQEDGEQVPAPADVPLASMAAAASASAIESRCMLWLIITSGSRKRARGCADRPLTDTAASKPETTPT
jgi:hypothetical protein